MDRYDTFLSLSAFPLLTDQRMVLPLSDTPAARAAFYPSINMALQCRSHWGGDERASRHCSVTDYCISNTPGSYRLECRLHRCSDGPLSPGVYSASCW